MHLQRLCEILDSAGVLAQLGPRQAASSIDRLQWFPRLQIPVECLDDLIETAQPEQGLGPQTLRQRVVLPQRQSRIERHQRFGVFRLTQQQSTTFDVVVDPIRAVRVLAFDCPVEVGECQCRFVALLMKPGPKAIEVRQPWLELDTVIQLSEGQVQFVQPAVGLGQVDIGLVRVRLPLDRQFQVSDGVFESLLPDAQDAAIDEEHIAGVIIEGHTRRFLEIGIGRTPPLKFLLSEAPKQVQPDEVGSLREAGAEQRPGLGGPSLAQEADRIEILRPEMAGLAFEHPIKFLDCFAEFLATIQLIRHQEAIEHLVKHCALGFLLGLRRSQPIAEHVQVACPTQVQRPGRRADLAG